MKAPQTVVVSLRKSGTHLVKEVISALGYSAFGQVFSPSEEMPLLAPESVLSIMQMIYSPTELDSLITSIDKAVIDRAVKRAIAALNETWRIKFGIASQFRPEDTESTLASRALAQRDSLSFSAMPPDICWFLHQLRMDQADANFLRDWVETGQPRIIFNYRDPRDTLVSMVNFLYNRSQEDIGNFVDVQFYRDIMRSAETMSERLTLALTDPFFPGREDFQRSLWLLRHPSVCNVSFEELVGAEGGGSADLQRHAVQRIIDFVGADVDAEVIAQKIFNHNSYTFFKGQIGSWRKHFEPIHEKLFDEQYGGIMTAYGYSLPDHAA